MAVHAWAGRVAWVGHMRMHSAAWCALVWGDARRGQPSQNACWEGGRQDQFRKITLGGGSQRQTLACAFEPHRALTRHGAAELWARDGGSVEGEEFCAWRRRIRVYSTSPILPRSQDSRLQELVLPPLVGLRRRRPANAAQSLSRIIISIIKVCYAIHAILFQLCFHL